MASRSAPIAPGAHIEVRDAVWRVTRVDPTSAGDDVLSYRCRGVSGIVRDQEAVFVSALEPSLRVLDPKKTTLTVDTSPRHREGRLYVESRLRDVPPPRDGLYVGHQAAMDPMEFQLQPAWRALSKVRQRILIADAVGLGKTLEAGILLSELAARGRARRILVSTTKSMLTQFQKELWCRFSLPLVRLDSTGLQRIRSRIPSHHNPFYVFDKVIVSIDTLKQNNTFRAHLEQAEWDVVVIDEAHNVAARGGRGSQRHQLARVLAKRCDTLIFLSATPHDGKPESFASLMNMLDPTAIADPSDYGPDDIRGLYVRRFKHDVADQLGEAFPERLTVRETAQATEAEEAAFDALHALTFSRIDARAHAGMLFKTQLAKSLFSSPDAALQTARSRVRSLQRRDDAEDWQPDIDALQDFIEVVEAIGPGDVSRYGALLRLVRERWGWTGRSRSDRLVVFTERIPTLRFLEQHLPEDLGLTVDERLSKTQVAVLHGGLSDTDQQAVVEAFTQTSSRLRLLIASDVASEGLNLHHECHRLVHFDVPWSLMVFQQRNGRIDRYGQTEQPLIAYLFTASRHPAVKGDQRILEVLTRKDEQAGANIGDPSAFMNVYDADAEERITAAAMESGTDADAFSADLDANLDDPFAALFDDAASDDSGLDDDLVPRRRLPSLFPSDRAFVAEGLAHLAHTHGIEHTVRPDDRLIELTWTPDLRRRYRHLPDEIRPADGRILLTDDTARMQRAMEDARSEESAWPVHQFLWPLNPVLGWLKDRLAGSLGRHTAPVLVVDRGLEPGTTQVLVSGQITNRRARPLLHRWYAVTFPPDRTTPTVQPFTEVLEDSPLTESDTPNLADRHDLDEAALTRLLGPALDAAALQLTTDRSTFTADLRARLKAETTRLATLRDKQLAHLDATATGEAHTTGTQRIQALFTAHERWVADAMTPNPDPFFEVIAVLVRRA